jgi:hypothetical protein
MVPVSQFHWRQMRKFNSIFPRKIASAAVSIYILKALSDFFSASVNTLYKNKGVRKLNIIAL